MSCEKEQNIRAAKACCYQNTPLFLQIIRLPAGASTVVINTCKGGTLVRKWTNNQRESKFGPVYKICSESKTLGQWSFWRRWHCSWVKVGRRNRQTEATFEKVFYILGFKMKYLKIGVWWDFWKARGLGGREHLSGFLNQIKCIYWVDPHPYQTICLCGLFYDTPLYSTCI